MIESMSDRELLERLRAVGAEVDRLIGGADFNSKYYTKQCLIEARFEITDAEGSLAWHVED